MIEAWLEERSIDFALELERRGPLPPGDGLELWAGAPAPEVAEVLELVPDRLDPEAAAALEDLEAWLERRRAPTGPPSFNRR